MKLNNSFSVFMKPFLEHDRKAMLLEYKSALFSWFAKL